jgi:hypothetical protein
MTADEYVKEYHSMVVPDFVPLAGSETKLQGMGVLYAPVTEYCNIKHAMYGGKTWTERKEYKDNLAFTFFPNRAKESDSYLVQIEGKSVATVPILCRSI